ncbi:hypothetical protein GCM10010116_41060 [Microbispora rosea subsp. aerata]|nr:hypothetical protein [Microbispora rosea]GGO20478.1 hypothetical protein GCM10010116_41060 [Microbispora rosea subsp. aerata]GIH57158.1 hypothetical protein Mro02_40720 [Microbispora rosea subsp. aerata]GLJ84772.1 hypothetical protein GCM10017588_35000 [Microbispora rosea subsp. aerata]
MRRLLTAGLLGLASVMVVPLTGAPVEAATCAEGTACDTTTTFDVTAGALEITVPDAVALANDATPAGYAYGQLGAVTVNDERASTTPTWTVTVTATDFSTGTAGAGEVIDSGSVYYCSGTATATTGNGIFTPGQTGCAAPPPPTGQTLDIPRTAYSHTGGTGNNSATWDPLITVAVGLDNVAGTYTGTISHTVA